MLHNLCQSWIGQKRIGSVRSSSVSAMEPPVVSHFDPFQCLRGIIYATLLLSSSYFGTLFFLMPLMPFAFLWPAVFRQMADFLIGFWLVLPSSLMELLFGVQIHVHGDKVDKNRPALLIMNHRTRLDWLFFWNALWRMDPWLLTTGKISPKSMLMFIPGAGWAMATNAFLFLERNFASDQTRIDKIISYYSRFERKYQLLLFPEGTDKCPIATDRSQKFAEKNGLVQYKYLLHPRTLGFVHLLHKMRKEKYVDFVYDVTVAYGGRIIQSEMDLILRGLTPGHVYFLVQKISISSLPDEDEQLEKWLMEKWAEKEKTLHNFYASGEFFSPNANSDRDHQQNALQKIGLSSRARLLQVIVLAVWLALTTIWAFIFFGVFSSKIRWLIALFTAVYFVGLQLYYGGFELFLARCCDNRKIKALTSGR
uniref:PlsC domain-containing protein n=1 Tax=Globodera pallida TaxID=36090 RepID=A0A183CCS2_GLOPA